MFSRGKRFAQNWKQSTRHPDLNSHCPHPGPGHLGCRPGLAARCPHRHLGNSHANFYQHPYIYTDTDAYSNLHQHPYTHIHVYPNANFHQYPYFYFYFHTHTHTYIHTHSHSDAQPDCQSHIDTHAYLNVHAHADANTGTSPGPLLAGAPHRP